MGNDVILAGHVGVTDHLVIGDRVRVAAKSAVFGDIPAGASMGGNPARAHRQFLRAQAAMYRLAAIVDDLERLVPSRAPHG
jgi:UDP-3-O-[3-hydroxymyristoyl] glucosamine N-acyltransferase